MQLSHERRKEQGIVSKSPDVDDWRGGDGAGEDDRISRRWTWKASVRLA